MYSSPASSISPAALSMAARTSAVISIIWFLLLLRCNHGSGQAVPLSFCRHSPNTGLWRHGFYILFRWISYTRTAAQCTVPRGWGVPFGVLLILQKIEIHSGISHRCVSYPPLYSHNFSESSALISWGFQNLFFKNHPLFSLKHLTNQSKNAALRAP